MSSKKVAIMGFGVVGSGVYEVLTKNADSISGKIEKNIEVKYILDIVDHKGTGFDDKFIKDFSIIENDPEISVAIEVIGGVNPAYDFTKKCLEAGKSVVTSNKELVATKGAELLKIAKEHGVKYLFEASVGGGIPIIRPLRYCLAGNKVEKIAGIVNGTTNFILTKMFEENMSFEDALSLAQKLGYAERNPAADIEGNDACRKICILSSLISGKHIYPEKVYTKGITEITSQDVEAATFLGYTIKLVAFCKVLSDNNMQILVAPMLIPKESRLHTTKDVFNNIVVNANAVGQASFFGPGAGKLPTASAVVSDIIECIKNEKIDEPIMWQDSDNDIVIDHMEGSFSFFGRAKKSDTIVSKISSLLPIKSFELNDEILFITDEVIEKDFSNAIYSLENSGEKIYSTIRVLN